MLMAMPRFSLLLLCGLPFSLAQVITPAPSLEDLVRRVGEKNLEHRDLVSTGSAYQSALRACYGAGAICGKASPLFAQCNQAKAGDQLLCWCTVGYYDARHDCLSCQASVSMIDSSSYFYEKSSDSLDCSSRIGTATRSGATLTSASATLTSSRSSSTDDNYTPYSYTPFSYTPYSYTYSSYRPTYTGSSSSSSSSGGGIRVSSRKKFPLGAIIGIVVGAIVAIGGAIAAVLARRRKKNHAAAGLGPPQMTSANPPPNPPPASDPKTGYFAPEVVQNPPPMSPQQPMAQPPVSPISSNFPPGYFPSPQQQQGPPGYHQQQPGMSQSPPPQQTFTPPPGAPPPQNFSPPPGLPPQQQPSPQPYMWQGGNPQGAQMPTHYGAGGMGGPEPEAAEIGGKEAPMGGAVNQAPPRHEMGS
ncbi:MAG: hypothetical protein M1836_002667 [Candelina mexicana]|nr:MAG: hypothetical protein M1836_002667 [Candelina mexicana]